MPSFWGVAVPVIAIGGWAIIMLYRMYLVGKSREQVHRERMAMIERGLVPPPESDAERFERMTDWRGRGSETRPHRSRRTGIILLAVGLAFLIQGYLGGGGILAGGGSFTGVLLTFMGVAFLLISMFEARSQPTDGTPRTPIGPPTNS